MKVLVIDNDADVRHLLDIRLRQANFDVQTVPTGEIAREVLPSQKPDVVITEVRLPGIDGLALTREIKKKAHAPLVILLTGQTGDADIVAGFAAGADDYLTKPFSPLVLIERLRVNLIRAGQKVPTVANGGEQDNG